MCEIFPRVYLGDRFTSQDASFMRRNNITHVVNCTKNLPNFFKKGGKVKKRNYISKSSSVLNDFEEDSEFLDGRFGPSTVPPPPSMTEQRESEEVELEVGNVKYYRISVEDSNDTVLFDPTEKKSVLLSALQFVKNALADPTSNLLVHCFEGRSRSVAVLIAVGMFQFGKTLEDSYRTLVYKVLQRGRDIAMNESFQMQLMKFEKRVYPNLEANSLNFIPEREREESGFFEDMDDESNEDEDDENYEPKRKKRRKKRFVGSNTAHEIYQSIKEQLEKDKERLKNAKFKQRNIMTMFTEQRRMNEKKSSLEYRQKKDVENLQNLSYKQKSLEDFFKMKKKKKRKKGHKTGKKRKRD